LHLLSPAWLLQAPLRLCALTTGPPIFSPYQFLRPFDLPTIDHPRLDEPFSYALRAQTRLCKKTKTITKTCCTKKQLGGIVAQSSQARHHDRQALALVDALWLESASPCTNSVKTTMPPLNLKASFLA